MSSPRQTVGALVHAAAERLRTSGSETPRLDAEVLLGHVLRMDRASLLAHAESPVGPAQAAELEAALERRAKGEPVAYIRGVKEFYGIVFAVDPRVLIPRPETEALVEIGLARIVGALTAGPRPAGTPPLAVADVGTGSGAIAISLAFECRRRGYSPEVRILASDASSEALALARENAVGHGVADVVSLAQADLLDELPAGMFDLVLANLPYVPSAAVAQLAVAASFEPRIALDGGPDGLDVIRRLLDQLPRRLADGGTGLLEIGADQVDAIRQEVAERLAGWSVAVHADLGGQPRVAELRRGP